jgi:hypothetical protein
LLQRCATRSLRHVDAHTRRSVAQLKRLGHTVVLDSADSLA